MHFNLTSHHAGRAIAAFLVLLVASALAIWPAWQATSRREAYLPDLQQRMRSGGATDPGLLALTGARLAQAKRYHEASDALERALAAGDNDPQIWLAWAAFEAVTGNSPHALGILDVAAHQGVAGSQDAKKRIMALGDKPTPLNVALAISSNPVPGLVATEARGSFLNGLFEWWGRRRPEQSGFATREDWAREEPSNPLAQRLWGEALLINQALQPAEDALHTALALAPDSSQTHLDLARLYVLRGMEAKAEAEYTRCLALKPGWLPAREGLSLLRRTDASPLFEDVTAGSGIHYTWTPPGKAPYNILQTIGNGCAFLDYNNDGNLDILLVGEHMALYQGDGRGHFTDVSRQTGLTQLSGHFLGCAVGDYDNDGYEDLYLSAYRGGVLLHNVPGDSSSGGSRRFRDVTRQAGLKPQPWGTSCAFADVDNDRRLDLYIGNYVKFGPKTRQLCDFGGILAGCSPEVYQPERGVLYHNEGNGHFRDATSDWGASGVSGKALGVAFADYDGSGRDGLAIANDVMPGDLLHNTGSHFENYGVASGTAFGPGARKHAGMGIDWGDYDNDGKLDLAVGTFQAEPRSIYHNNGSGLFTDRADTLGIANRTLGSLAFGVKWLDYDNDGWLDLAFANGHVNDQASRMDRSVPFLQPPQLFHNERGKSLKDVSGSAGSAFQRPILGRGLAVGDFDNDGRIDILLVNSDGSPELLHNETARTGHWLALSLTGTKSNRDGIGAMVTVTAGGLRQVRRCGTDGSYLSASDRRVHFGLGPARSAEQVRIRWPSGIVTELRNVPADQITAVRE